VTELSPAATEAHRAIEAIWRIESARLIAGLVRVVGDIGTAEELAQDALVAALEQWPISGVPEKPGAWLMGTARHHAIDLLRRRQTLQRKHEEIGRDIQQAQEDTGPASSWRAIQSYRRMPGSRSPSACSAA